MRLSWKALGVAPLLVAAVPLPPLPLSEPISKDASSRILELDALDAYAKFQLACPDCFRQEEADDALIFDVKVFLSEEPCGFSNISINGLLPLGTTGQPFGNLSIPIDDRHHLGVFWNSSCLTPELPYDDSFRPSPEAFAQFVTVQIGTFDGREIPSPTGFTLSFKQFKEAQILKLSLSPDSTAGTLSSSEPWRHPGSSYAVNAQELDAELSLDDEIEELKILEAKAGQLQNSIEHKRQWIKGRIWQELEDAKQELKKYSSTISALKALFEQTRLSFKMMCLKFRPCTGQEYQEIRTQYLNHDDYVYARIKGGPQKFTGAANSRPLQNESQPPSNGYTQPTSPVQSAQTPLVIALELLATALGLAGLLSLLRRRLCCLRRRVERLSDREERRRACEYRRTARRQALKARCNKWWSRLLRRNQQPIDTEEKRRLVETQEEILEKFMENEIEQLFEAEDMRVYTVDATQPSSHAGPSQVTYIPITRNSVSRTNSLPDYRSRASSLHSGPPGYDSTDEAMGSFISTGLIRHAIGVRTPESSVVDVSPRISAETLRSMYSADQAAVYPY